MSRAGSERWLALGEEGLLSLEKTASGRDAGLPGSHKAISPTVASKPTVDAAMRPADRTWTRCAILRRAPAECGDQPQFDDSGGGIRRFNSPANSEFDRARATTALTKVVVKLYGCTIVAGKEVEGTGGLCALVM